jgi:hypothetical protein
MEKSLQCMRTSHVGKVGSSTVIKWWSRCGSCNSDHNPATPSIQWQSCCSPRCQDLQWVGGLFGFCIASLHWNNHIAAESICRDRNTGHFKVKQIILMFRGTERVLVPYASLEGGLNMRTPSNGTSIEATGISAQHVPTNACSCSVKTYRVRHNDVSNLDIHESKHNARMWSQMAPDQSHVFRT